MQPAGVTDSPLTDSQSACVIYDWLKQALTIGYLINFNGTTITRGHYDYDKTTTSKMISSPILTSDYDKAMGYNPTMQAILDRIPKETMKEIKDMCTKHPPYLPKHNII